MRIISLLLSLKSTYLNFIDRQEEYIHYIEYGYIQSSYNSFNQ